MKKRALDPDEQQIFYEYLSMAAHASEETVRRYALLISVQWFTGCRVDELLSIKVRDLDTPGELIHILSPSKGSYPRSSFVPRTIIVMLTLESAHLKHNARLCDMISGERSTKAHNAAFFRHFNEVTIKLFGVSRPRFTSHALRYTAALRLLELLKDTDKFALQKVQNFLGHRSILSTAIYLSEHVRADNALLLRDQYYGIRAPVPDVVEDAPDEESSREGMPPVAS